MTPTSLTYGKANNPYIVPRIGAIIQQNVFKTPYPLNAGEASIAFEALYAVSIITSKISILLLYLRVFTSQKRAFALILGICAFIIITVGVVYASIAIFQCSPVKFAWDKSTPGGQCLKSLTVAKFLAIPNIIDGLVMLIIPIPLVWQLAIETQHKIALTATFFHGIIGFIASCVRLAYLCRPWPLDNTSAITLTIWTLQEPANYNIAACLPTLRPIFIRVLPEKIFFLSRRRQPRPEKSTGVSAPWKLSWSWARLTPKISLVSRGESRLTGPWDGSCWASERGEKMAAALENGSDEDVKTKKEQEEYKCDDLC